MNAAGVEYCFLVSNSPLSCESKMVGKHVVDWKKWFSGVDENLEVELYEIWPEGAKLGNVRS